LLDCLFMVLNRSLYIYREGCLDLFLNDSQQISRVIGWTTTYEIKLIGQVNLITGRTDCSRSRTGLSVSYDAQPKQCT
jgi:hypothetical protein